MTLEVLTIPLLRDNYGYLIVDRETQRAVAIDPSAHEPVIDVLERERLSLDAIWCTHHHWDHVGGIPGLLARFPDLAVLGSAHDATSGNIERQTRGVADGEVVEHGGVRFEVLAIPGHTLGAIAYVGGGMAFTGDTLFLGGCGRVFEGTMPIMRASLARLRALPPDTRIYCGHEYTKRNLEFARVVEPNDAAIAARLEAVIATREEGRVTVPATIAEELATNPFLRWDSIAVRAYAKSRGAAESEDDVFARIREAKDSF
ncbi:hydroxyacylglutathione hydrolase [Sandaracinus amylolyticus]|uniref:Hydroxyacylglutathione hydrolase n=1 Tax=Sandaracinus amylolyticus TaxID=927083 RepID=A0A0F6SDN7_9BACT|nr:hydroxyacylglutathione hydrolase [Sandaracinus amylolyticus]AKF03764.1 Hydroxyacylglutathione hydrolase [Sandaracinus amylolyticus]